MAVATTLDKSFGLFRNENAIKNRFHVKLKPKPDDSATDSATDESEDKGNALDRVEVAQPQERVPTPPSFTSPPTFPQRVTLPSFSSRQFAAQPSPAMRELKEPLPPISALLCEIDLRYDTHSSICTPFSAFNRTKFV
eukprot:c868_g1_i2.p1 GENE.c868_g1_i2~~c868_g1_i2.p1  ORF type:complete len:138 (+),score=20.42 c868_g1_i2:38-451(+)